MEERSSHCDQDCMEKFAFLMFVFVGMVRLVSMETRGL